MTPEYTNMINSFNSFSQLSVNKQTINYFSLPAAEQAGLRQINRLPFSLKILLENLLRHEDGRSVTTTDIQAMASTH